MSTQIAIIGAGMAGLAAAYDLNKAGYAVTVFERASQVGGLASGFKAPHWDWTLEKFYHHWFQSDEHMLGLIEELGWSDQVLFPRPYTVVYHGGQFQPLDSIAEAAKFTLRNYSVVDFMRFGFAGLYLRLTPWWKPLEKVTADAWLRKYMGENIYKALWRPMLIGKFGEENLDVVNMAWFWARLKTRTTRLGTFVGGFQAFLDKFADVLRDNGVDIRLNSTVLGIRKITGEQDGRLSSPPPTSPRNQGEAKLSPAGGGTEGGGSGRLSVETEVGVETFDAVISTSSPALMARLAPDLPDSYAASLRNLKSMGAVVMVITLKRQLTQYYWHNLPKEAGFPFLAMVEHTNYVGPEHFGGDHIIYCGDYLQPEHEYFHLSKEELLERFLPALKRFNPDFDPSWVKESWLFSSKYAQPVPPINHSQNIPPLRTPVPGLYFASMSQVYPWDRGTNFAVEIGRKVASMVTENL